MDPDEPDRTLLHDPIPLPARESLERAADAGLARYFAERRARVDDFVDRHFTLRGSARLHRHALGWDIARAPANLSLAAPQASLRLVALLARRAGYTAAATRLERTRLLFPTEIARRTQYLLTTELLELPCDTGGLPSTRDALAETILAEEALAEPLGRFLAAIGRRHADPDFRAALERAVAEYGGSRAAAAEITTGLLSLGAGAVALNKLTPGAVTLGPSLAALLAQQSAVASFPLGSGLGGLWYAMFPAAPSFALLAGMTGGLMLLASTAAAFAGMVADPVQRRLGLHRRRLLALIDAMERHAFDPRAPEYAVRDHYVARLIDLFDLLASAARLAHL